MWSELYNENNQPDISKIKSYVNNPFFNRLLGYIESTYSVLPKTEYSKCSMQQGWNIKYKKNGRSLCTLYPMKDFFIALVVIGDKEQNETELLLPALSDYTQNLYNKTPFSLGGRWLMIEVKDLSVLMDVINLIDIRAKKKKNN